MNQHHYDYYTGRRDALVAAAAHVEAAVQVGRTVGQVCAELREMAHAADEEAGEKRQRLLAWVR